MYLKNVATNRQLKEAFRLFKEREIDCQDYSDLQKFSLFLLILDTTIKFSEMQRTEVKIRITLMV